MNATTNHSGSRLTRPSPGTAHRAGRIALIAMEGIVALAAYGGGASMLLDPAGAMGLTPEMLDRLPVNSWLLPGVALIATNGVLPTATVVAELRGQRWPQRFGHVLAGAVLLAWPVTETYLFGYPLRGEPVVTPLRRGRRTRHHGNGSDVAT